MRVVEVFAGAALVAAALAACGSSVETAASGGANAGGGASTGGGAGTGGGTSSGGGATTGGAPGTGGSANVGGGGPTASSASGTGGGGVCVPGSTMPCICHEGGTMGEETCLPDGSGWGPCGGACQCPEGRSDGCCPGDGICCSCVSGCGDPFQETPEQDAFINCVCQPDVCGSTGCMTECMGGGIGADCGPCAQAAANGDCASQAAACP